GSGELCRGTPVRSAVGRRDVADLEPASTATRRGRVEVVGEGQMRTTSRRRRIDGQTRNEMVEPAGDWVDRNTRGGGPGDAVCRGAEHNVVGGAVLPEAAVLPGDVDLACSINLSAR